MRAPRAPAPPLDVRCIRNHFDSSVRARHGALQRPRLPCAQAAAQSSRSAPWSRSASSRPPWSPPVAIRGVTITSGVTRSSPISTAYERKRGVFALGVRRRVAVRLRSAVASSFRRQRTSLRVRRSRSATVSSPRTRQRRAPQWIRALHAQAGTGSAHSPRPAVVASTTFITSTHSVIDVLSCKTTLSCATLGGR